jgi:hypothetical protein
LNGKVDILRTGTDGEFMGSLVNSENRLKVRDVNFFCKKLRVKFKPERVGVV